MRPPTITIPQDRETEASRDIAPGPIAFTYVYARSHDTRAADAPGQDFIAYRYDDSRIAFAVCDGVSQSFYGEIAARLLGMRLVEYLWDANLSAADRFLADLNSALHIWTNEASAAVAAKMINPALPEMHRVALERKRAAGSESMFAAGVIDRGGEQIALCWMGDMRLWLWDSAGDAIDIPGAEWLTRERWSSQVGPKNGMPHGCIMSLDRIARITAHSDGVGHFAAEFGELSQDLLNTVIREQTAAPASDDIAVLDIDLAADSRYGTYSTLTAPILHTVDPAEPVLTWNATRLAARYRVLIDDGKLPYTLDLEVTELGAALTYFPPHTDDSPLTCAVQALNDYAFPSPWSVPITFVQDSRLPLAMRTERGLGGEVVPAGGKVARPRRKSRLATLLTILVSATLLIVLIIAVWIVFVIVRWNDWYQLPSR